MKTVLLALGGAFLAGLLLTAGFAAGRAATTPAMGATAGLDRGAVEAIVYDYLITNPEILVAVQTALTAREEQRQRLAQAEVLKTEQAALFQSPEDGIIGNPDGKKTVVEFFDYNCGYCKHALTDMETMVEADPEVRFILKEFPILGPESQAAHLVSAAFRKVAPEKYAEFHIRLLGGTGRAGEAAALAVARDLGVEEPALRKAMKDPAIAAAFNRTYDLANKLSVTGTPAYVIGDEVVFGAIGAEQLAEKVAATN